jgi:hypothetical protein
VFIHITPDELEDEFKNSWKAGLITNPTIDYATNAIHCSFMNKEVIVFKFQKYGFINDNRQNKYFISSGLAGITIKIEKT